MKTQIQLFNNVSYNRRFHKYLMFSPLLLTVLDKRPFSLRKHEKSLQSSYTSRPDCMRGYYVNICIHQFMSRQTLIRYIHCIRCIVLTEVYSSSNLYLAAAVQLLSQPGISFVFAANQAMSTGLGIQQISPQQGCPALLSN